MITISVFRHGYIERREEPLSEVEVSKLYSEVRGIVLRQVTANVMGLQTPLANFSHYTYPHFREHGERSQPPIVWFVSHCNAHSGRSVSMIRF